LVATIKKGGAMEIFKKLEQKIASLVDLVKDLKTENAKLAEENAQLTAKLELLEHNLDNDVKRIDKLKEEKESTKLIVNDLIKNIELLVENQR
jgi:FtsZ-binding cell division protein ZapB